MGPTAVQNPAKAPCSGASGCVLATSTAQSLAHGLRAAEQPAATPQSVDTAPRVQTQPLEHSPEALQHPGTREVTARTAATREIHPPVQRLSRAVTQRRWAQAAPAQTPRIVRAQKSWTAQKGRNNTLEKKNTRRIYQGDEEDLIILYIRGYLLRCLLKDECCNGFMYAACEKGESGLYKHSPASPHLI